MHHRSTTTHSSRPSHRLIIMPDTRKTKNSSVSDDVASKVVFSAEEKCLVQRAVDAANKEFYAAYNAKLQELRNEVHMLKETINQLRISHNHTDQYSRRSHIRIRGLEVEKGVNCKGVVSNFLNTHMKRADGKSLSITPADIDAAHPLPSRPRKTESTTPRTADPSASSPPPDVVIVRFHRRDTRDAVIRARRSLKGTKVSIQEDLTRENAALLRRLSQSPSIRSAWSWEGKIYGAMEGIKKPKRFDILDEL